MIQNIEELIAYAEEIAKERPTIQDSLLLIAPGSSEDEVQTLCQSLTDLDQSYVSVLKAIKLDGISIGAFNFSDTGSPYFEELLMVNSDVNGVWEYLTSANLYEIGTSDGYSVCLAKGGHGFQRGEIAMLDIEEPSEPPKSVADDFATFLLIAGNLNKIFLENRDDREETLQKFNAVLDNLHVSPTQKINWGDIVQVLI